jgi:transposase
VIVSEDEAWMYLQATTMNVWSLRGQTPVVGVDAGRSKVGFLGTLDLETGEEIVTRSAVFNAQVSAQHLHQVLDAFPGQPILFFWDRAPWHRGDPIRQVLAANPQLEIIEYPVAAPELNPQEQVWKQTRRAVSHNHIVPKLPNLADDFEHHLRSNTFETSFLDRYGYNLVCPFSN